jgi:hypothetical protein
MSKKHKFKRLESVVLYFKIHLIIVLILSLNLLSSSLEYFIEADNPKIQYTGRIDFSNPKEPILYWPGTYIIAKFEGTSIKIRLNDIEGENYYNIIIDDNDSKPIVLDCEQDKEIYSITSELKDTIHKVLVFRRTETFTGSTIFKGFILDEGKGLLEPQPKPKFKIEFYGNSITSGMGNECIGDEDEGNESKKNNYLTYSAITARNLNAEYVCISKSGIGILISWFPQTMPEFYYRLNPSDPESMWDFSKWTPDIVVINLFQNDSWLIEKLNPLPDSKKIIRAYIDFIQKVREKYPEAHIFCTLGSMDATEEGQPWPGYIKEAVKILKEDFDDKRVYSYIFAYDGTGKHPRVNQHFKMAEELTIFIKSTLNL